MIALQKPKKNEGRRIPSGFFASQISKEEIKRWLEYLEEECVSDVTISKSLEGKSRTTKFFYGNDLPAKLKEIADKFRPPKGVVDHVMFQTYEKGYDLPMHRDGVYGRIVIVNLVGKGDFYIGNGYRAPSRKMYCQHCKPGSVVIMDGKAATLNHGVPTIKTDRTNVVIRYYA